MTQKRLSLLGVPLDGVTKNEVLDKIKLYLSEPAHFIHIMSINPENIVIAQENKDYMALCQKSDLALTDGVGVLLAARILGAKIPERVQGSILLPDLLDLAGAISSTVVLIGSQANLAEDIAKCYSRSYPEATFIGTNGYQNCLHPTAQEELAVEAIVRASRPHFVFVAFGSPQQELWIESHRELLEGSICMGVGGAFDYLSGAIQKPPSFIRTLGLEWLYRLVTQPWRIKRQGIRLPLFIGIVIREWIRSIISATHE